MIDIETLLRKIVIMLKDGRGRDDHEWAHYWAQLHMAADLVLTDPAIAKPHVEALWTQVPDLHVQL